MNWYFVENGFHGQTNLGNTGLNKVNGLPVNSEERELTLLPKHVLHMLFISVEEAIKFTLKNTALMRMTLRGLAPKCMREENGKREKRYN